MIRINQLKLNVGHSKRQLEQQIEQCLRIQPGTYEYEIVKQSMDCRPKHPLKLVYSVDIMLPSKELEQRILKKSNNNNVMSTKRAKYEPVLKHKVSLKERPVVVGTGPAGLFCGYVLALNGYRPILLERGQNVKQRSRDVEAYWNKETALKPDSNVQFGEGGAGTFSDGKLNTVVKDKYGRQRFILNTFVECGAPEDILYLARPHIGTDYLKTVVTSLRKRIEQLGGEVRFGSKVENLVISEKESGIPRVQAVILQNGERISASRVVLAIGHSARDTFQMLFDNQLQMEQKPFAVGVRMEHPRELIDALQYKEHYKSVQLPTANYKMTHQASNGRSVFTFCMCPGGYVVNASSEAGGMVVNGMSNYDRMADNSNSAIVASVTPADYEGNHPLAGVEFQRKLERAAFAAGGGEIPLQLFGDFCQGRVSKELGMVHPCEKGGYQFADVSGCLPESISSAIIEAVLTWNRKMPGYAREDALVTGVESRTSSPVKILRDEGFESNIKGLFPCGEGAGYAGGIMSAAIDGCKVAEAIMKEQKGE